MGVCCASLGIFIDRLRPDLPATRRRELAMDAFFSLTLNYEIGSQSGGHSPLKKLRFYVICLTTQAMYYDVTSKRVHITIVAM
jgi:hypothetical protein